MPGEYTALAPAQMHGLLEDVRALHQVLTALRSDEAAPLLDRLMKLEPCVTELLGGFRLLDDARAKHPDENPVVYCGMGAKGKLNGFPAHLMLSRIDSLRAVVFDLLRLWGWQEFVGPEGGLDSGRLASSFDHLPLPTCDPSHVQSVRSILDFLERSGADLSHFLGEKVSCIPMPTPRGPGSWEIPGASPYRPGERPRGEDGSPDRVRIISDGPTDQWGDISNWQRWPLDRPYGLVKGSDTRASQDRKLKRFDETASWVGSDTCEFRCVLRSAAGQYYALGGPSGQWYRDRLFHPDGTATLASEPRPGFFHGMIDLLEPADRRLLALTPHEALGALLDSGHANLPDDLKSCLENDAVLPPEPVQSVAPLRPSAESAYQSSPPGATAPSKQHIATAPPPGPEAKAIAAAYELKKQGLGISLKKVCELAGVDRKNIRDRHPEVLTVIKALATPDRELRRGTRDRRTSDVDGIAWDDE